MAAPKKEPAAKVEAAAPKEPKTAVVHIVGADGRDRYAWRSDGVKPVINMDDFARNIHSALDGKPGADFADHVGPH